jgi:hypothetical protein
MMSLAIEMTVRGVLLAGKWAQESDLPPEGAQNQQILEGWRTTLISAIVANTNEKWYQEQLHVPDSASHFKGLDNEALIGIGAMIIFLLEAGFYDSQTIKNRWDDYLRNDMITQNGIRTGRPGLQGMTNQQNVRLALQWFPTGTPKHPKGDVTLPEPTFGDPNNTGVDPTVLGYFEMLFEQARTRCLAGDQEKPQLLLAWINNVFPAVPADKINDPKYPEYANVVKPFTKSVVALKKSLQNKLDYYGYAWNHVPMGSLAFYKGETDRLLASLKEIEGSYDLYLSASRTAEQRRSDYVTALDKTKALRDVLEEERKNTEDMIKGTVSDFNATQTEVEQAWGILIEKMRGFSSKIQKCFGVPSAEQLAGVMLNLSFMPEKGYAVAAMTGSQALTAGSETVQALSKVTMDDGSQIDKSLVINRLDVMGKDVTDLGAAYTVSRNFIQRDAGVYRLIQKAEAFDEFCRNFYNEGARDAQTAMDDYIRKIKYRNAKIDEYNALWARLGDLQGQLAAVKADLDSKAIALARTQNPSLPHRVAAFGNVYNRVRDAALRKLYSMGRAYSFWALKDYDELARVCKLADPDSIDYKSLKDAMGTIEEDCAGEIETWMSELRQAAMPDLDAVPLTARGITVTLTKDSDPEFIESLKSKGVALFDLPPTHESFGGKINVRVRKVRAWIYGLKTGNDVHDVIITHCGPETIRTPAGKPIDFQHDRVSVIFRYDAAIGQEDPRAIFQGREGCHDGVILEHNYAPIGPFTHWRLAIPGDSNKKPLDRSGINKVVMEFHIIAQPLATDTTDPAAH